jgi:integrase
MGKYYDDIKDMVVAADDPRAVATARALAAYIHAATARRTRQAYQEDLQRFLAWGGKIPSSPEAVAAYLAAHGETHAPATLGRWAVSLGKAHTTLGLENPCKTELVRTTLRGIRRRRGLRQRRVAPALRDDLIQIARNLGSAPRDVRDRALMLIGFAGALRRSELVALTTADVAFSEQGLTLTIRQSKTDQEGHGHKIGIPHARGSVCPVQALRLWLDGYIYGSADSGSADSQQTSLPIFRAINKHGQLSPKPLTAHAVALIVKQRCAAVGLLPELYSGHSLRAGFCTSAALMGAPNWKIKKISRHKTDAMVNLYVRDARLFNDNPLEGMF